MAAGSSLARRVQRCLEHLYKLDALPSVDDFARPCAAGEREQLLVRDEGDGVSLAVLLPAAGLQAGATHLPLDPLCQVIEGVSHFVYLAGRIAQDRPATQLELELQAEVDKFAVLALDQQPADTLADSLTAVFAEPAARQGHRLHAALYEGGCFLHDAGSEQGQRYRLATTLAARFWAGLGATGRPTPSGGGEATVRRLRDFHRAGQADKIRLARAA